MINSDHIFSFSNQNHTIAISRSYALSDTTCSVTPYSENYLALNECIALSSASIKYAISGIGMQGYDQSLYHIACETSNNWILQIRDNHIRIEHNVSIMIISVKTNITYIRFTW